MNEELSLKQNADGWAPNTKIKQESQDLASADMADQELVLDTSPLQSIKTEIEEVNNETELPFTPMPQAYEYLKSELMLDEDGYLDSTTCAQGDHQLPQQPAEIEHQHSETSELSDNIFTKKLIGTQQSEVRSKATLQCDLCEKKMLGSTDNYQARLEAIEREQATIKNKIDEMQGYLKQRLDTIQEEQAKGIAEISGMLKQILSKNMSISTTPIFPIKSVEGLEAANKEIGRNMENFIQTIRVIVSPDGLSVNFERILGAELIQMCNYDGVSGKITFKDFRSLNMALFEAIKTEGMTNADYVKVIRDCFRSHKHRLFKRSYDQKKKDLIKSSNVSQ